jgi:hypothetical protein
MNKTANLTEFYHKAWDELGEDNLEVYAEYRALPYGKYDLVVESVRLFEPKKEGDGHRVGFFYRVEAGRNLGANAVKELEGYPIQQNRPVQFFDLKDPRGRTALVQHFEVLGVPVPKGRLPGVAAFDAVPGEQSPAEKILVGLRLVAQLTPDEIKNGKKKGQPVDTIMETWPIPA